MSRPHAGNPAEILSEEAIQLPAVVARNERLARFKFWPKLLGVLARVPFVDDLLAVYYCAVDPKTPSKVKAVLLATIAYFIIPSDLLPDFLVGLGFTDDAAVLTAALTLVGGHITDRHRMRAKAELARLKARGRR
ncbi:MAG: DUF1232 domain-containing protein [Alphaproteobacteria bacterium]|nr:DUF1232 domain-containing protein [Alphaproteobacteria bacterium]